MLLRSLYFRFFLTTIGGMLLVIGGLSYVSYHSTKALITHQVEEDLGMQARQVARDTAAALQGWSATARLLGRILHDARRNEWDAAAQRLFEDERSHVAFALVRTQTGKVSPLFRAEAPSFTTDASFGLEGLAKIRAALSKKEKSWATALAAEKFIPGQPAQLRLATVATGVSAPVLLIAVPTGAPGKHGERDWAFLSVWDGLTTAFGGDGHAGWLLSGKGRPVLSAGKGFDAKAFDNLLGLVGGADKVREAVGTRWLTPEKGEPTVAAFASVSKAGMYVMLAKSGELSSMAADTSIKDLGLWFWTGLAACVMLSYLAATGVSQNLLEVAETTRRIASGELHARYTPRGNDEVTQLGLAVNFMATEIQRLVTEGNQKARLDAELGAAQVLQNALLPPTFIAPDGVRIAGRVESASECGGDWWGRYELPGQRELLCVADVTGHGISASLVTGMICSFVSASALRARQDKNGAVSPGAILNDINQLLYEVGKGKLTATALIAVVDKVTGDVVLANAGHNPPLLIDQEKPDGETRITNSKCRALLGGANMLGIFVEPLNCKERRALLGPGDKLVLYTDGLVERLARGIHGTGLRSLRQLLHEHRALDAQALMRIVIDRSILGQEANSALADDVTVVVLEFLGLKAGRTKAA